MKLPSVRKDQLEPNDWQGNRYRNLAFADLVTPILRTLARYNQCYSRKKSTEYATTF